MGALPLGPFPGKWGEVATVAGDEDAVLAGGEFEHGRIVESFEREVFGECEHVMSGRPQGTRDAAGGEVGVEQQSHRRGYGVAVKCTKG